MRRRCRHSSPFLVTPASAMSSPAAAVETISAATCGSRAIPCDSAASVLRNVPAPGVRMAAEVNLPAAAVAHVRVQLGRAEVGMAQELLDAVQIGSALEQVRREGMAQQVR